MALKIFDTLAPQGEFPAAKAKDIALEDGTRLEDAVEQLRADILYEPITITSISIQPSVAQLGDVIENPTLVWAVSREPVEQTVDGVSVDPSVREYEVEGAFGGTRSVAVRVVDERGAAASKSATMNFYNSVYSTSHWPGREMPSDEELRAMSGRLQSGMGLTIYTAAGAGEYVLYACPSRMGTPEFWANGFQGGFEKLGTFLHTNAAGYAENYDVWLSNAAGLSGVTITVK